MTKTIAAHEPCGRGVTGVEHPVQVAATPTGEDVDADVKDSGDSAERWQRADVTALQGRHHEVRHAGTSGDVRLSQPATDPNGAQDRADSLVIHGPIFRLASSRGLSCQFEAAARLGRDSAPDEPDLRSTSAATEPISGLAEGGARYGPKRTPVRYHGGGQAGERRGQPPRALLANAA